jgi:hypothetical protein
MILLAGLGAGSENEDPSKLLAGNEDALHDRAFWIRAEVTAERCEFHPLSRPAKRQPIVDFAS